MIQVQKELYNEVKTWLRHYVSGMLEEEEAKKNNT